MAVYVDDMEASYGRVVICHMLADTTDELLAMADKIGVQRKWLQKADSHPKLAPLQSNWALDNKGVNLCIVAARCASPTLRERERHADGVPHQPPLVKPCDTSSTALPQPHAPPPPAPASSSNARCFPPSPSPAARHSP